MRKLSYERLLSIIAQGEGSVACGCTAASDPKHALDGAFRSCRASNDACCPSHVNKMTDGEAHAVKEEQQIDAQALGAADFVLITLAILLLVWILPRKLLGLSRRFWSRR